MKFSKLLILFYPKKAENDFLPSPNLDISQVAVEQVAYLKGHHSFGRQFTEYFKRFIHWDINVNTWIV
jgi:hypothetical protein